MFQSRLVNFNALVHNSFWDHASLLSILGIHDLAFVSQVSCTYVFPFLVWWSISSSSFLGKGCLINKIWHLACIKMSLFCLHRWLIWLSTELWVKSWESCSLPSDSSVACRNLKFLILAFLFTPSLSLCTIFALSSENSQWFCSRLKLISLVLGDFLSYWQISPLYFAVLFLKPNIQLLNHC